jgi:transcriptional regulator of heat shock response
MNNDLALEIAQRVREMENEIRSLRTVLRKYWTHAEAPEPFVEKGIAQLQERQKMEEEDGRLQQVFHAASDDAALWQSLRVEVLGRMGV